MLVDVPEGSFVAFASIPLFRNIALMIDYICKDNAVKGYFGLFIVDSPCLL